MFYREILFLDRSSATNSDMGGMITMGFSDIHTDPHITFMPASVLFQTILSLNLIGDRLRRKFGLRGLAL